MALGVLIAIAVALASMSGASVTSARDAHGAFLAQGTALRAVERMQSEAYAQAYLLYWDDANVTKRTINGKEWAVAGGPIDELQLPMQQASAQGRFLVPSSDAAFLRIRFLNEQEYANLWGISPAIDLDFSGGIDSGATTAAPAYSHTGVVVEVH